MNPLRRYHDWSWEHGVGPRGRLLRVAPVLLAWTPLIVVAGLRKLFGWPDPDTIALGWPLLWLGLTVSAVWVGYGLWRLARDVWDMARDR